MYKTTIFQNLYDYFSDNVMYIKNFGEVIKMNNSFDYIITVLKRIFWERYKINLDNYTSEVYEKKLFGREFNLAPRDLIYLFYDIEKLFKITILEEDIAQGKFDTIYNIACIINNRLVENVSSTV